MSCANTDPVLTTASTESAWSCRTPRQRRPDRSAATKMKIIQRIFFGMSSLVGLVGLQNADCKDNLPLTAQIVDYGVYDIRLSSTRTKVASTISGNVAGVESVPVLVSQTNRVSAVLGTSFGFRFVLTGGRGHVPPVITFHHTNPGIHLTGGDVRTSDTFQNRCPIGETQNCILHITHEREAVRGLWRLRLLDGDRLLAEKEFMLLNP